MALGSREVAAEKAASLERAAAMEKAASLERSEKAASLERAVTVEPTVVTVESAAESGRRRSCCPLDRVLILLTLAACCLCLGFVELHRLRQGAELQRQLMQLQLRLDRLEGETPGEPRLDTAPTAGIDDTVRSWDASPAAQLGASPVLCCPPVRRPALPACRRRRHVPLTSASHGFISRLL